MARLLRRGTGGEGGVGGVFVRPGDPPRPPARAGVVQRQGGITAFRTNGQSSQIGAEKAGSQSEKLELP